MDNKLYSLLNWSIGNSMPPTQLQLHLTNKCNLNCMFCPTKALYKKLSKEELSLKKWKSVINEAISFGVKDFHLCGGGEPFFYKETALKLMEMIKRKHCRGEVITNGTLLSNKDIKKLVKIEWDKITFSLNSSEEGTDDFLRSKGAYKKTINNIKKFTEYKRKLNKSKPVLALHVVLCNKNYKDIYDLIKLASELGCNEVFFNSMNVWSKKYEYLQLNKEKIGAVKKQILKAEKLANEMKINTNLNQIENFENLTNSKKIDTIYKSKYKSKKDKNDFSNIPCFAPWFNIAIFPNGNVSPCFLYKFALENINKKTLKEIWEGKRFNEVRRNFLKNKINPGCKNCNVYDIISNKTNKQEISNFSNLLFLWNKIREDKYLSSLNKEKLAEKEKEVSLKSRELILKVNQLKKAKTQLRNRELKLNDAVRQLDKISSDLLKNKIKLKNNMINLKNAHLEIEELKKNISFFEKELSQLYNSKGYRFFIKPLDKVYVLVKKKNEKKKKNGFT